MPDGAAPLSTGLPAVSPPLGESCARPIGRRGSRPPRRAVQSPHPPPSLALLGELRNALAALAVDRHQRFRHVDRVLGRQERDLGRLAEAAERILARLVAIERACAVVEQPQAPRPMRRAAMDA